MDKFSYFMAFYGLLLGLAATELLLGFGNLLRARVQPRWGILTPLLGLNIFIQIIATLTDAWRQLQDVSIDFSGIAAPALIGVSYVAAAIMVVPRDSDDWATLDDYFTARRRVTIGALILPNVLTILCFEFTRVLAQRPAAQVAYWLVNAFLLSLLVVAMLTRRRRTAAAALAASSIALVMFYATSIDIPAGVGLLFGI